MAAPKKVRELVGDEVTNAEAKGGHPITPVDQNSVAAAVQQLQSTVNAVIARIRPPSAGWIVSGGVVTKDTDALTVDVTAGELEKQDGTYVAFAASADLALATAHATLARVDLVQVAVADGTITKKNGTAAASPVAPAVDTGNLALATVPVAALATAPGTPTDVRVRPARGFTGAAVAAQDLFTTD